AGHTLPARILELQEVLDALRDQAPVIGALQPQLTMLCKPPQPPSDILEPPLRDGGLELLLEASRQSLQTRPLVAADRQHVEAELFRNAFPDTHEGAPEVDVRQHPAPRYEAAR